MDKVILLQENTLSQDDMIIDIKADKARNLRRGMNGNGWRVECVQPTWAEIIN